MVATGPDVEDCPPEEAGEDVEEETVDGLEDDRAPCPVPVDDTGTEEASELGGEAELDVGDPHAAAVTSTVASRAMHNLAPMILCPSLAMRPPDGVYAVRRRSGPHGRMIHQTPSIPSAS